MPTMLRHRETGEMYPFNRDMAKHPDMEMIDQPDPQFKEAAAKADTEEQRKNAAAMEKAAAAAKEKADAALKKAAEQKKADALAASKKAAEEAAAEQDDVDLDGIDLSDA
jgi:membrane protein involved in colicin uptake